MHKTSKNILVITKKKEKMFVIIYIKKKVIAYKLIFNEVTLKILEQFNKFKEKIEIFLYNSPCVEKIIFCFLTKYCIDGIINAKITIFNEKKAKKTLRIFIMFQRIYL